MCRQTTSPASPTTRTGSWLRAFSDTSAAYGEPTRSTGSPNSPTSSFPATTQSGGTAQRKQWTACTCQTHIGGESTIGATPLGSCWTTWPQNSGAQVRKQLSSLRTSPRNHGSCTCQSCPAKQWTCPLAETSSLHRRNRDKGGPCLPPGASWPSDYHSALDVAEVPSIARRCPLTPSTTTSTTRCHGSVYKGTRGPPSPLCPTPPYNVPKRLRELRHYRDEDCLRRRRPGKGRDHTLPSRYDEEDRPKL